MYRECIDRAQDRLTGGTEDSGDDDQSRPAVPTITLAQLKESVGEGESIITELDMVGLVLEVVKGEAQVGAVSAGEGPIPGYQYLLTVSMAYAQSLLSFLIYPHRRLQHFLFDLCVESRNLPTLQQLVNFHVILDSGDLLEKLGDLESKLGEPWMAQTRLDTAKRMKRTDVVVQCLIAQERTIEIVEYLRRFDAKYEIEKVFDQLKNVHAVDRQAVWEQVEVWNTSPGLEEANRPVLSHRVIMLNSRY